MSVGHSQGGGAVWKLSETESTFNTSRTAGKYIGTVALAPASKIYNMLLLSLKILSTTTDYASYAVVYELPWLPIAVKRIFPNMSLSFLSDAFLERLSLAELAQACYYSIMSLSYGLTPTDVLSGSFSFDDLEKVKEWQEMAAPATGATSTTPLLIIQGSNDTALLPNTTIGSFEDTCGYGNEAHLSLYQGMDHTGVIIASSPEWLGFISRQFANANNCASQGRRGGGCSKKIWRPFDPENMVTEAEAGEIANIGD